VLLVRTGWLLATASADGSVAPHPEWLRGLPHGEPEQLGGDEVAVASIDGAWIDGAWLTVVEHGGRAGDSLYTYRWKKDRWTQGRSRVSGGPTSRFGLADYGSGRLLGLITQWGSPYDNPPAAPRHELFLLAGASAKLPRFEQGETPEAFAALPTGDIFVVLTRCSRGAEVVCGPASLVHFTPTGAREETPLPTAAEGCSRRNVSIVARAPDAVALALDYDTNDAEAKVRCKGPLVARFDGHALRVITPPPPKPLRYDDYAPVALTSDDTLFLLTDDALFSSARGAALAPVPMPPVTTAADSPEWQPRAVVVRGSNDVWIAASHREGKREIGALLHRGPAPPSVTVLATDATALDVASKYPPSKLRR
jgi:hypothetical protein